MQLSRTDVIDKIEKFLKKTISAEEIGWWAFDIMVEPDVQYEPGFDRLIKDALQALHYFHETEPMMATFYPETEELIYYLKCLRGEELYNPRRVPHWKV